MTDAFGRALQAITDDGDAAFLFSQRDFSSLGDHGFDEREQDLLQAAAEEVTEGDDVSGFEFQLQPMDTPPSYVKIGDIEGMAVGDRFQRAYDYYRYELKN